MRSSTAVRLPARASTLHPRTPQTAARGLPRTHTCVLVRVDPRVARLLPTPRSSAPHRGTPRCTRLHQPPLTCERRTKLPKPAKGCAQQGKPPGPSGAACNAPTQSVQGIVLMAPATGPGGRVGGQGGSRSAHPVLRRGAGAAWPLLHALRLLHRLQRGAAHGALLKLLLPRLGLRGRRGGEGGLRGPGGGGAERGAARSAAIGAQGPRPRTRHAAPAAPPAPGPRGRALLGRGRPWGAAGGGRGAADGGDAWPRRRGEPSRPPLGIRRCAAPCTARAFAPRTLWGCSRRSSSGGRPSTVVAPGVPGRRRASVGGGVSARGTPLAAAR
jgi:hypothetical protein